MKIKKPQSIFLDGDEIRDIFNNENIQQIILKMGEKTLKESVVCVCGDNYSINVIASVLSIFLECRWNRKNFKNYFEVFLDVPMDILIKRDTKRSMNQLLKVK